VETDIELVARAYRDAYCAAGRRDPPARDAATEAWMARHPEVPYKQADLMVARLICRAIDDGLVWGNVRWWEKHQR
jgi:hypothetical protein